MSFQVEISSVAKAEADAALLLIAQLTSVEQGQKWYSDLIRVISNAQPLFVGKRKSIFQ